jgi:hypothetical protein
MTRTPTPTPSPSPTSGPTSRTLREFDTYAQAQSFVDRLADTGFPVDGVRIVGTGLHLVEQVRGRVAVGRALAVGAVVGAWVGLMIGLIFTVATLGIAGAGAPATILGGLGIGAFWGTVAGFVVHRATAERRDFPSIRSLAADRYAVQVEAGHEAEAARAAGFA